MHQQEPFYPDDEEWDYYEGEYYDESYEEEYAPEEEEDEYEDQPSLEYAYAPTHPVPEMGILIGIVVLLFFVFVVIKNGFSTSSPGALPEGIVSNALTASTHTPSGDPLAFAAPYTEYTLTQGLHGQAYGHLAIDLAAGRGSPVLAPINGIITDNTTDQYGNTTLVIENEMYQVLLLHGDFSATIGVEVHVGDQVGTESNHGYTTDMVGNLCYGAAWCGNHTHLNVFDKRVGTNINPLDLIP